MALLFMDSFDHYLTADINSKWSSSGASGATSALAISTNGRRGSGAFRWTTGASTNPTGFVNKAVTPSGSLGILGFSLLASAASGAANGTILAALRDTTGIQALLYLNPNMTLSVYRGLTVALLGTTASAIPVGTATYLEWKTLIATSGGTTQIRVNGVSVLSLTGLNTAGSGTTAYTTVDLGQSAVVTSSNTTSRTLDFDDLYVLDGSGAAPWNDVLGDCRVDARYPTGAGATTGWTPSAGANWAAVDETAPNGDTDYVAATAVATDTYATQDAPVVGATIYGVQHCLSMKKMDAGVCTVAPVIRHSGVDYPGADIAPGVAYAYGLAVAQVNPGTSAAWTEAGFNAAEFGFKRTT